MFAHVLERTLVIKAFDEKVIIKLVVLALGVEIAFRRFVQGRLQWIIKPRYAILLTSVLFALMHVSPSDSKIVVLDLTSIFIDSVIFGVIFYKTKKCKTAESNGGLAFFTMSRLPARKIRYIS